LLRTSTVTEKKAAERKAAESVANAKNTVADEATAERKKIADLVDEAPMSSNRWSVLRTSPGPSPTMTDDGWFASSQSQSSAEQGPSSPVVADVAMVTVCNSCHLQYDSNDMQKDRARCNECNNLYARIHRMKKTGTCSSLDGDWDTVQGPTRSEFFKKNHGVMGEGLKAAIEKTCEESKISTQKWENVIVGDWKTAEELEKKYPKEEIQFIKAKAQQKDHPTRNVTLYWDLNYSSKQVESHETVRVAKRKITVNDGIKAKKVKAVEAKAEKREKPTSSNVKALTESQKKTLDSLVTKMTLSRQKLEGSIKVAEGPDIAAAIPKWIKNKAELALISSKETQAAYELDILNGQVDMKYAKDQLTTSKNHMTHTCTQLTTYISTMEEHNPPF